MTLSIVLPPKATSWTETRRFRHQAWKSVQRYDPCAWSRKRTGQDRTGQSKKSQRRYISLRWGEAPTQPICTKICRVAGVRDVTMHVCKVWDWNFQGLQFYRGGRIFSFPIDSCMGLAALYNSWALLRCVIR